MGSVGRFGFNDGLDPILNPNNNIRNEDYKANLEHLDSLISKTSPVIAITSAYSGGNTLSVTEAKFFSLGQKLTLSTPTGSIYHTNVASNPTTNNTLTIVPIDSTIPIGTIITLTDPDIESVLGSFNNLDEKFDSILTQTQNQLNDHINSSNAHDASQISATGSLGNNVQTQLDALNTNKLNTSALSGINSSITTGDNQVRSEFQAADLLLQQGYQAADTQIFEKINLFSQTSSYVQRDSNGSPIFPNVSFNSGTPVQRALINDGVSESITNYPSNVGLASFVGLENVSSNNYLYGVGGLEGSSGLNNVYKWTVNTNGTLGSPIAQANLPTGVYGNSAAAILDTGTGEKRLVVAGGGISGSNRLYISNPLVANNGNITTWITGAATNPSSAARSGVTTVTVGSNSYIYVVLNQNSRTMLWKRWNEGTLNIDGGSWNSVEGGMQSRFGATLLSYKQGFFMAGGQSKDVYYVSVSNDGTPNFNKISEILPQKINFPKLSVCTILNKDYLVVLGGTTGSDYNSTNGNNNVIYYEITKNGFDLKLTKIVSGGLNGVYSTGSGAGTVKVGSNYYQYIHCMDGNNSQGNILHFRPLNKNVNAIPVNVSVSGGEYVINNELVSGHPVQTFNNLLFSDDTTTTSEVYYLFARKDGTTKDFILNTSGTVSDNKNLLVGSVVIDNITGLGSVTFYDSNIIQDLLNSNNHKKSSIIKGCDLSYSSAMSINITDGLFDYLGKVYGTTGLTVDMSQLNSKEIDYLGPVELQYVAQIGETKGSLVNVLLTGGKRYLYKIGGFNGSIASSNVQKGELDSNGCLKENLTTTNCAPLPFASDSWSSAVPITMNNGDVRILVTCGGTNKILLSSVINTTNGAITSWTTYTTNIPSVSSNHILRTAMVAGTLYIYLSLGGSSVSTIYKFSFNLNEGTISALTNVNMPVTTSNGDFNILNNSFAYVIAGNTNNIYYGSIQSNGDITWKDKPIKRLNFTDILVNFTSEFVNINGTSYLYIFGGNRISSTTTDGLVSGYTRIKVNSFGLFDGEFEEFAFPFQTPSEQAGTTVVNASGNFIVYRGVGWTVNGYNKDSYKFNMVPIYSAFNIGNSLLYFDRLNNGIIQVLATKKWSSDINPLTVIGLVTTDGTKILNVVSVAKNRLFETSWLFGQVGDNITLQHNLLYPIKLERLLYKQTLGSSEVVVTPQPSGNSTFLKHRSNRRESVLVLGTNAVMQNVSDDGSNTTSSPQLGQFKLILEA